MSTPAAHPPPTPEQLRAISTTDRDVLLEAGAGTGKTRVLVDRYCDAVVRDGIDAVLAFTFTERAAAELRHRIRIELRRRADEAASAGEAAKAAELEELAGASERAWISTIHGFCRRLLASHPVALGLDPRFRVLDETEAGRIAQRAFDEALELLLEGDDGSRARLVAAMRIPDLRDLIRAAHDELRSQGRAPELPEPAPPDAREAIAQLARAAAAAVDETSGGAGQRANLDKLAAAAALGTAAGEVTEAGLAGLELKSKAKAFCGPACNGYRDAWKRARAAVVERDSIEQYEHLTVLLRLYGDRYGELKAERSGLDYEDLQLEACRLLADRPAVAESYRSRFTHLMVDEFQDTNLLQLRLVGLLQGEDTRVFCVGDEFQSIYGFRHADLRVFRAERERIDALPDNEAEVLPLRGNFRSSPEIVATANALGEALLDGFSALTVGALRDRPAAALGESVDLLLTPAGNRWEEPELGINIRGDYPSAPDRIAEARFLAARLRELADAGVNRGDMVVLLRAYTHVAAFDEELERAGLRPYVVGGRGYWSQQQVDDIRRLLGLLANPLDDESLLGVLASPACAVLPDTLWLLRRAKGDAGPLWPLVEREFGAGDAAADSTRGDEEPTDERRERARYIEAIPNDDAERLRRMCGHVAELRAVGPRVSLEELVERAVTALGYDLAALLDDRGARRYANVRKLMRMAREFEAVEGRDLRGLVDYLVERAGTDREGEAATEAEGHDGVRVMTVHAAKGLEFPVVAVADLGRELLSPGRPPAVKLGDDPPRVGIRLARLGAKAIGVFGYDELLEGAIEEEAAESCRLAYVAATRAQDRLILSGRYDPKRLARQAGEGPRPSTPVTERLMRSLAIEQGADATLELPPPSPRPGLDAAFGPAVLSIRFNLPEAEAFVRLARHGERAPVPEASKNGAPPSPPLDRPPALTEPAARHLSYSALATYGRCEYRFFVERVIGLGGESRPHPLLDGSGSPGRYGFGSAVHAMLEWSARNGWRQPDAELCRSLLEREGLEPNAKRLQRAESMVVGWLGSNLRGELGGGGVRLRPELPFMLPVGDSVIRGTIDLLAERPGEPPLLIDYKTDSVAEAEPPALVDRYGVQRLIYALAAAGEKERVRTAYVLLERPDEPVVLELGPAELADARTELEELIDGVRSGRFEVTPQPHKALCWDCPARQRLCSHPPEMTERARPEEPVATRPKDTADTDPEAAELRLF